MNINEILKSIPNNKKGKFDEAYVKELYTALLNHNVKDLDDIPKTVKESMVFVPVENVQQVLHQALEK